MSAPDNGSRRKTIALLFALYALAMLALLFLRTPREAPDWNLTPLRTIAVYFRILCGGAVYGPALRRYAWINLLGNVVLFIPLGLFLPALFKRQRSLPVFVLTVCGIMIIIEAAQALTSLGTLDIDDLLLNELGALLGFALRRR